ncbi:MAG TPA: hypothetical protein VFY20_00040 [Gemmatimonadales bacterium]|nr:hypothetical protein [Gemmatimonadales bacterium]
MDGRLLHVRARDTVPATGTVMLHRVSPSAQGAIDSAATRADGGYSFRFRVDSLALYLLSSRHHGIEYFSRPLRIVRGAVDTTSLLVHDTSSVAPVTVMGRYWVIGQPTGAARRPVLDLAALRNAGTRTRVGRDSLAAVWTMPLPKGAADVAAGDGEFSPAAIEARGDSLAVLAPLVPGDRQLVVQYTLPLERRVSLPVGPPTDSLVVLLEQRDATVRTAGFAVTDSQVIENRTYRRWVGVPPTSGVVEITFPRASGADVLGPLVAALALALGVLAAFVFKRRAAPVPSPADRVSRLVEEIAGLDAAYAGREGDVDAETWRRYQADRARLRHELDAALAIRGAER